MYNPTHPTQPPDALTQHFWQAWREQMAKTPRLAPLLLQRGRQVLERFQHFYTQLCQAPRPLRRRWQRKLGASLAGVALALALSNAPAAQAFPAGPLEAHINGTDCLLVDAITAANTDIATGDCDAGNPGADTITLLGNVTLDTVNGFDFGYSGLPSITSEITIEGEGYTIARDTSAPTFRILTVFDGGSLTLNNTTISGGATSFNGGGILNAGTLALNDSTVSGNHASGAGGGIFNYSYGNVTISNSTVSGNQASAGGGILNLGTLALNDSTFSGNQAYGGSGIHSVGDATISNSTVSGNSDMGIAASGMLTLNNSAVTGNGGDGVNTNGTATLTNSTISGNNRVGVYANGYDSAVNMTLTNSTITGNGGPGIRTRIDYFGFGSVQVTLERSLISGNSGGNGQEIFNYVGGCLSAAAADAPTCLASASASVINSADRNLFGHSGLTDAQAFVGFTPDVNDIVATSGGNTPTALSAILDTTLQVNAPGDTATHALVAGSPAIDAATSGPATDQRGVTRPQGCGFDIGAYELEQPTCPTGNEAPVVAADSASVTVDEGQMATNSGTVSDPDGVVNNNDGTWSWSFNTTDDLAGQTVTITADDGNDGVSETSFDLTVNNVAPTVGAISAPVDPQAVGTAVNASAGFSDPGTGDTHTAEWDWGDGSTSAGTVGSGTVGPNSHTYTTPGVYTVKLTVTDDDGGVGQSIYQYVVIYDPAGGFVTGGGWITSPAGAYPADPSLTGKANFGFNAKYKKGQSTPDGNTQFQFQTGNLNFKSSSYEWLVVAGANAKFKGVGTINGSGNYGFMLTATDGQVNGGGGTDKFRIKIWDKDNGDAVVYDNQMGQGDDSNAGTALGGGSIVIHKGGANGASADDADQANAIFLPLVTR